MAAQTILFDGKPYVVLPRDEYDRLTTLGQGCGSTAAPSCRTLMETIPAVDYARASLARKIIRDRVAVGLSQRQLALRAGVRVETLCRIETGKHTPSMPTIEKLDRVLRRATRDAPGRRTSQARQAGWLSRLFHVPPAPLTGSRTPAP